MSDFWKALYRDQADHPPLLFRKRMLGNWKGHIYNKNLSKVPDGDTFIFENPLEIRERGSNSKIFNDNIK